MDVLRKELNAIYASQHLELEILDEGALGDAVASIRAASALNSDCLVVTDASADVCFIAPGRFGLLAGFADDAEELVRHGSSDEDIIYKRLHPEDLVDKRMLEYEFFKFADRLEADKKTEYCASCRIRMRNREGEYVFVENTTRILRTSPKGHIWLILCRYSLSPDQRQGDGIRARIINEMSGEVTESALSVKRSSILSEREKEVLRLIKSGRPSKQIADVLGISIHTVNRHRQNILEKLSVGNSLEAVRAATEMKLL